MMKIKLCCNKKKSNIAYVITKPNVDLSYKLNEIRNDVEKYTVNITGTFQPRLNKKMHHKKSRGKEKRNYVKDHCKVRKEGKTKMYHRNSA